MKKKLFAASLAFAASFVCGAASADPPGTLQVPTIVIHGRPDRPMVVIDFARPSAASAAGAAHQTLREEWLKASAPHATR